MKKQPLVSVIIVNYNGKNLLEKCFDSLSQITYTNYEIILVDNNSDDDSINFINENYPETEIIRLEKNYGFAKPNNIGARKAKGQYLLFLNNDTIVTPTFMDELIFTMENDSKIGICQSLLLESDFNVDSSGDFVDELGRAYSSRKKPIGIQKILSAKAASMIIRTSYFFQLDGFDEKFFASFEDVDIGWRAWILGFQVVINPNSIVYHLGHQTIKNFSSTIQFHSVKNSLILRLTNFEFYYSLKSILSIIFVILMKKIFKISIVRDPEVPSPLPSIKIMLKGSFWVFKNLKYVLKKRRIVNKKRIKGTKDLIKLELITKIARKEK